MAHDHAHGSIANTGAGTSKTAHDVARSHLDGIHSGSHQRGHHRIVGAAR